MDSIVALLIVCLLLANLIAVIFLIRRRPTNQIDNSQIFKDEVSSLKNSFSQSFGSMSKEIAKDMTGALTKVDEKVGVFNRQVSELNKSQDNFSKILSGVKTYGTLAEFGLGALLKDLLPASQFIANVKMKEDTSETVEFAIKLPEGLLLPIDAKFPSGLFDNYLLAVDTKDQQLVKKSKDDIKRHVQNDAKDINLKYMQSGITIDLGVMYIPSESLMQLIDSMANLREEIFRDHRVLIMGPNSLAAYLISVHMGFRTLALNERAGEIMQEFGKLKKEFLNFGGSTEDLQKRADAMLKAVNEHATRERQMEKAIKNMDQLDS